MSGLLGTPPEVHLSDPVLMMRRGHVYELGAGVSVEEPVNVVLRLYRQVRTGEGVVVLVADVSRCLQQV